MAIAGKRGKLCFGTNQVVGVKNWSLSLTINPLETTALGDSWKNYIVGLKEWTASASGDYQLATENENDPIRLLNQALATGSEIAVRLYVDETHYYGGNAVIGSLSIDDSVEGTVSISIDFTGSGELTFEDETNSGD